MPTSSFYKFNQFVEDLAKKVHNLSTDQLAVAPVAAANAPVATNEIPGNLTRTTYTLHVQLAGRNSVSQTINVSW